MPSTGIYRHIRKVILNPYTQIVEEAAINTKGWIQKNWCSFLLHAAPYCATPLKSLFQQIKKYNCTAILCQDYEHARFDTCILLGELLKLPVFATFQGGNWQMSYCEKWIRPFTIKACKGLVVARQQLLTVLLYHHDFLQRRQKGNAPHTMAVRFPKINLSGLQINHIEGEQQ